MFRDLSCFCLRLYTHVLRLYTMQLVWSWWSDLVLIGSARFMIYDLTLLFCLGKSGWYNMFLNISDSAPQPVGLVLYSHNCSSRDFLWSSYHSVEYNNHVEVSEFVFVTAMHAWWIWLSRHSRPLAPTLVRLTLHCHDDTVIYAT